MIEHLHRVSFNAPRAPRKEMLNDIRAALKKDIHYELPENYMRGAGDTYFSGKMLAKLARIILIAKEVGGVSTNDFSNAVGRLRAGVEIWLNGSAAAPLLYDLVRIFFYICLYSVYLCHSGPDNGYLRTLSIQM
jgi:endoglucanase Acf2